MCLVLRQAGTNIADSSVVTGCRAGCTAVQAGHIVPAADTVAGKGAVLARSPCALLRIKISTLVLGSPGPGSYGRVSPP